MKLIDKITLWIIGFVMMISHVAFGSGVPADDAQAAQQSVDIYKKVTEEGWWAALGPIVAVAFYYLRKYDTKIPMIGMHIDAFLNRDLVAFAMPFVISTAGGIGTAIGAGTDWKLAAQTGLKVGGEAIVTFILMKKMGGSGNTAPPAASPPPTGGTS